MNLEKTFGIQPWSVAYAYCELRSDEPMETDLRLSDRPAKLWLNGKPLELPQATPGNVPRPQPIRLKAGLNRLLLKLKVNTGEWAFSMQPLPPERATVEVLATDPDGRPVADALVEFYVRGRRVWRLRTGEAGQAVACLYPLAQAYDLRVTSKERGAWRNDLGLDPGERRRISLELTKAISISGHVQALDGSPQNAIVVQALRVPDAEAPPVGPGFGRLASADRNVVNQGNDSAGRPLETSKLASEARLNYAGDVAVQSLLPLPPSSETVLSDTNGYFRFVNLRPGAYRLRCHGPDGYVYPNGGKGASSSPPIRVGPGRMNDAIRFELAEAKKGVWRNYTVTKGLIELMPTTVHRTPDGRLWLGTANGTLHSYDGIKFRAFEAPWISGGEVHTLNHDADGTVWAGASEGVSRTVDGQFQPFPCGEDKARDVVNSIVADSNGSVWFGTAFGLYRYSGGEMTSWGVTDGLPSNYIWKLMRARDGAL